MRLLADVADLKQLLPADSTGIEPAIRVAVVCTDDQSAIAGADIVLLRSLVEITVASDNVDSQVSTAWVSVTQPPP